ncbi:Acylphosphatase [Purpureocillium takamizusanense]|uniref:acylphosphatase n=1 Tax=Purpureocillium takamizusanense TaxID=2060973 RepID=A0A9Q8Q7Y6_9HYPO|nr:Acylphosphatase [Purpureocillium takamizusanense]UNI14745.1 Acylphosphatase [Purpureocillium takamizusanense]
MPQRFYFVAHGGVVQGVGFRYFTREKAREYGVTGWCRNTSDNKVEGEVQGEDEALQKFFKDIDDGPRHAHVVQVTREDREAVDGEQSFSVRR